MRKALVLVLIMAMLIPVVAFAVDVQNNKKQEFFTVDKTEATQEETITMDIDLSKIEYEDFEFTLASDTNLNEVVSEKIDTEIEKNQLKIVSSKSEINMEKISLYYKIPKEMEVGTVIKLTGTIKEYVEENEKDEEQENKVETVKTAEIEKTGKETQKSDEKVEESTEQKVTVTIKVIEKKEDVKEENKNNEEKKENESSAPVVTKLENTKTESTVVKTVQTTKTVSSTPTAQSTVTYKGESNNYLSTLVIEGYEINPVFSKTNNTYFVNIPNDVTSLNVTATAEDNNAKVCIYGNEDLQQGSNKILISVTAENGEVKMYRIYVNKAN